MNVRPQFVKRERGECQGTIIGWSKSHSLDTDNDASGAKGVCWRDNIVKGVNIVDAWDE